jgi:hypothetical protein
MWYAVSYFTKGVLKRDPSHESWEESVILVQSWSEDAAREEVMKLEGESFSYETMEGDEMTWVFDSIASVFLITDEDIGHGTEIFSRFLKPSEVASLKTKIDR